MPNSPESNRKNMDVSDSNNSSYEQKTDAQDVVSLVDDLLKKAVKSGASDVHFEPTGAELAVKFRLDGVLSTVETLPRSLSDNVIARLKVLGGLLTYRNDIPQEGRIEISMTQDDRIMDQRLAVFPTIHGQRANERSCDYFTKILSLWNWPSWALQSPHTQP
ncbi:MAG: ATPase, T2SS/T4P/T4SS family [Planctomycetota bacterium]